MRVKSVFYGEIAFYLIIVFLSVCIISTELGSLDPSLLQLPRSGKTYQWTLVDSFILLLISTFISRLFFINNKLLQEKKISKLTIKTLDASIQRLNLVMIANALN